MFFNNIEINYIDDNNILRYTDTKNNTIMIDVCKLNIADNDFEKLIIHELTHAYEDYNRKIKNVKTLDELIDNGYVFAASNLFVKKPYIDDVICRALYFLNDQERNAYLSSIKYDIKQIMKKHNWTGTTVNLKELVNEIKQLNLWQIYFSIGDFIIKLNNNELDNDTVNYFVKRYNSICKSSLSKNKIVKDLFSKWLKLKNKFDILIPKICTESVETTFKTIPIIV